MADESRGNREERAEADRLIASAAALVPEGEWRWAADALERAANLHAAAGRGEEAARCLQYAATLRRASGDAAGALRLVERAAATPLAGASASGSVAVEQAESAMANGRYGEAAAAWTRAIDRAREVDVNAQALSGLHRRRAAAELALGDPQAASGDFDVACSLISKASGEDAARFVRLEQAGLLERHGRGEEAAAIARQVEEGVGPGAPPHLVAELCVLRARLARRAGHAAQAVDAARRARQAALDAVAPVSYFAAAVELAEALDGQNERPAAYRSLATAWATLADLLGHDVARSWVEPVMLAYRLRWSSEGFDAARAEYEAQRREELQHGHS